MKMTAQEKLLDVLLYFGYTEAEAHMLLAQFLEEEAEIYVECMRDIRKQSYS